MDRSDIMIRRSEEKDLPFLTEIYNSVIKEGGFTADIHPFSIEERHEWYHEHLLDPYLIYVLENESRILGYFYFSPWRKGREALSGVIELSFFLRDDARGKGLGDMILESSIDLAKDKGFSHLLAILLDVNQRSRRLLEKWGFEISGILPGVAQLDKTKAGQLIMLKKII